MMQIVKFNVKSGHITAHTHRRNSRFNHWQGRFCYQSYGIVKAKFQWIFYRKEKQCLVTEGRKKGGPDFHGFPDQIRKFNNRLVKRGGVQNYCSVEGKE